MSLLSATKPKLSSPFLPKHHIRKQLHRSSHIANSIKVIRLCKDCVHYSEDDDSCKALNIVNYKEQEVSRIKSLYCRTREDLCGMNARYYEPKHTTSWYETRTQHKHKDVAGDTKFGDDIVTDKYNITYYIDGSSGLSAEVETDSYYDNLHTDFNDVY